eukprot:GEMP01071555.1.p1 GENE.GEMP01071555.1~~GEMP01071555.1.p1  ORF type:complete len:174 (+),score=21.30 GEMP01071555.1:53-523(+)
MDNDRDERRTIRTERERERGDRNKVRGRGGKEDVKDRSGRYEGQGGHFESIANHRSDTDDEDDTIKSIDGWVIIVSRIHEEAQEDDIFETFSEFGAIKNLHLNLDRRTGFVKGYAFIEYEKRGEAAEAIHRMDKKVILEQKISVAWAFKQPPKSRK